MPISWGIIGPGKIAEKFAGDLKLTDDGILRGIGSRQIDKARSFANKHGAPNAYGSYRELVEDPEIDIIYIAVPHPFHKECTLMALNAGKAVLCEKPFAVNADDAMEMIECAREKNLFLMEARWTRCLPAMARTRYWLKEGKIGAPRMVTANFGFRCGWQPEDRLLNPNLAGGALLDVGVYTIEFATMIFGPKVERVAGLLSVGETGVDEQGAMVISYPDGAIASLATAVRTKMVNEAWIFGTEGKIHMPNFFCADSVTLFEKGQEPVTDEFKRDNHGFVYEIEEVHRCLKAGKVESDLVNWRETRKIMKIADALRHSNGLTYPFEET